MSTPVGTLDRQRAMGVSRERPARERRREALGPVRAASAAAWRALREVAAQPAFLTLPLDHPLAMDKPIGLVQVNIQRRW